MYYLFIVEFAVEDQTCFFFVRMKLSYAIAKCIFKVFIVRILALVGVTLVVSDILRNCKTQTYRNKSEAYTLKQQVF